MANFLSIARPYALAAFENARDKKQLPAWKMFLENAAFIAKQPSVNQLLENPAVSSSKIIELFCDVLSSQLDQERKNFLFLLSKNNRLLALPDISNIFNAHVAALEKSCDVRIVTAVEAQTDFKQLLKTMLEKRLKGDVTMQYDIDQSIIGGAIIHIGDKVIDGSIRGKLTRLLEFSLR